MGAEASVNAETATSEVEDLLEGPRADAPIDAVAGEIWVNDGVVVQPVKADSHGGDLRSEPNGHRRRYVNDHGCHAPGEGDAGAEEIRAVVGRGHADLELADGGDNVRLIRPPASRSPSQWEAQWR